MPLNLPHSSPYVFHTLQLFGATKRFGAPFVFDSPYIENDNPIRLAHFVQDAINT